MLHLGKKKCKRLGCAENDADSRDGSLGGGATRSLQAKVRW